MQALANALLSELASRTISFLASTFGSAAGSGEQEDLQRLQRLLLRSGMIVEEAESRRVTNRVMLRQLGAMRDEMLKGYYVLDTIRYQPVPAAGGARGDDDPGGRLTFGPSVFNPAKRVRFRFASGGDSEATVVLRRASSRELQQMVSRLEASITDTKELVLFLTRCPLLHRQPYSAHLFVDKYMFGRHAERDLAVEFLLQVEPHGAPNPGVLPIVGPRFIGKSTLVEHVRNDGRVCDHFSFILFYKGEDLEEESVASFVKNCVVKHQNNSALGERWLIVIELVGDLDDGTWKRLYYSSGRRMPQGSKMILTSRSESIARFGTTQALRLKCLSTEAFWYFFKLLVFGSTDPGEHSGGLASMAMELALEARGSFMTAYTMAAFLRADFSRQSWCKVLRLARQHIQRNVAVFDEYPDDFKAKPWQVGRMDKLEPGQNFLVYDSYQKDSSQQEDLPDPEITLVDLLSGRVHRRGRFEILHWKSIIPPYFSYISPCEIRDT